MASEYFDASDLQVENPAELGVKDLMRMEWQANYFASSLLLPERQFIADFLSVAESFGLKDRGFGLLYLDEQACNLQSFFYVTGILKDTYKVASEPALAHLEEYGRLFARQERARLLPPRHGPRALQPAPEALS